MPLPKLETKRLLLDPVDENQLSALHDLWTHAEVRRYLWDNEVISLDRAAAVITDSMDSSEAEGLGMWTVYRKPDSRTLVGFVALRHPVGSTEVEILYGLQPSCWGEGLATEASKVVLKYAFTVLRLPRVLAGADAPNTRSFSVMRRLGMLPLGSELPSVPGAVYFAVDSAGAVDAR